MAEHRIWIKQYRVLHRKLTPTMQSSRKKQSQRRQMRYAAAFLAPSVLGVFVFVLLPFADVVRRSFFDAMCIRFVGWENYRQVLTNTAFRQAAFNTAKFLLVCVPLLLLVSLLGALLIQTLNKKQDFFKSTFLFPMAVPVASVALLWKLFFHQNGFLNMFLEQLHLPRQNWLNSSSAFGVLVFTYIWKNFGYDLILWLAGLGEIPKERYEAASVDGANRMQQFWYVTLPGIRGSLFVTAILSMVNCFKVYREAYLLAGNYPHDSIYLLQHIFNNWFVSLDVQKMAAGSVLLALVMLGIMVLVWRYNERA
ncbi:MAG: carbohydrate ABC transporter permease [Lachnospiraceae bacterium]